MRKVFATHEQAIAYCRGLAKQGIQAGIFDAYNWEEQRTIWAVVPLTENKTREVRNEEDNRKSSS